jgi:hydrogenase nickel incorporation protein HypA/HybF
MHEMSIAQGLLHILEAQANVQSYRQVKKIWLEIGPLAVVEPASLLFCFDAVARNTLAEGAILEIIALPGYALCQQCGETVQVSQRYDACIKCGSYRLTVTQGDELRIKSLEVE